MVWKVLDDFNNYAVSDKGEVKNVLTGRILKPRIDKDGYKFITVFKNNGRAQKNYKVHRLVALYFVENEDVDDYTQVDHIDLDKTNNHASNLRWTNNRLNRLNTKMQSNNTSGYKGICKNYSSWRGIVQIDGKQKTKTFKKKEDAIKWRKDMVAKYYDTAFYREY